MSKQTAVQWLERRFHFTKGQLIDIDFEQALQMEREQIVEAGRYYFHERGKLTPQQYYEQIYGGQDE